MAPPESRPPAPSPRRDDVLATFENLGPAISAAADETSARRRIGPDLLERFRDAGLFRIGLPAELGGTEVDLPTMLEIYETIARFDGSTGWVAMIGSGTNTLMTALPPETARTVFEDPDIATGGLLAPRGRAVRVDGGYRVTGRWPFGSGSEHCRWLLAGAIVHDEDGPVTNEDGPETRVVVVPQADVTIHDTWHVTGLRGTGSHDYSVDDLFVPDAHTFHLFRDRPAYGFPHRLVPVRGFLHVCLAAAVLGMARGLLDALADHAIGTKLGARRVADAPLTQTTFARSEAAVRGARAYFYDTIDTVWAHALEQRAPSAEDDVGMRLAAGHAVHACSAAADLVYAAGGTAALFEGAPMQRFYRDIKVAQQHGAVAYYTFEGLGRELLEARAAAQRDGDADGVA